MGSPSVGSDSIIINPGANSSEARMQNFDSLGDDLESPELTGSQRKKRGPRPGGPEKGGRGLRHFSMKVCEKVELKRRTTYNEVADELIAEITNEESLLASVDQQQYDEKNIRRRVYDALNVLMAMDIISKDKKEIQWKGLPNVEVEDVELLKAEHMQLRERLEKKAAYLRDLEDQITGIQNLIERNERYFREMGTVPANGVALPFILVQTRPHATVEVEISEDMQLVHFDFNSTPFKLHDDAFVLKAMRLSNLASNEQSYKDGVGNVMKMESIEEKEDVRAQPPRQKRHMPVFKNGGNHSNSLPLPGILKARVKQEYHV